MVQSSHPGPWHDVLGIARPGEKAGCTPPHPLFWQSQKQSFGLIGLTCANLQTRDNEARHPLALGSNHCSLFSSFFGGEGVELPSS